MNYKILVNSPFAAIARKYMKSKGIAMVLGKTIHLSGVSKEEFLLNKKWVHHELVHIRQFQKYGFLKFLFLYLIESIKNGYYNNKFEVEAREEEKLIN